MGSSTELTLEQIDIINLSLAKVTAIAEVMAGCGQVKRPDPSIPTTDSIFVVMQVMVDELDTIRQVMQSIDQRECS
ncbi:MAG: hypothetical protein HQL53_08610 [Magnetococcales bacterium]|nr:hypothetical protein [Magnetococcales bacterium]